MGDIDEFLTWLQHSKGRSEGTIIKYRQCLIRLRDWAAENDLSLLNLSRQQLEVHCGVYAHQIGLTPKARRPIVSAVRGFYLWAHKSQLIQHNPAEHLEPPKTGRRLPRSMNIESYEKILMMPDLWELPGVRDAAMIAILGGCGARISEVSNLNEESLNWFLHDERQRLEIRLRGKGGKERIVQASPEAAMMIQAYLGHPELDGIDRTLPNGEHVLFVSTGNKMVPPHDYYGEARRLSTRGVFKRLIKYGKEAGIPREQLNPHALRHMFGRELVESDVDIRVIQALLGHADIKTTQIYTALAKRKLIEKLDTGNPLSKVNTPVTTLARTVERNRKRARTSRDGA